LQKRTYEIGACQRDAPPDPVALPAEDAHKENFSTSTSIPWPGAIKRGLAQLTVTEFDVRHPKGADYVVVPAMTRDDDPAAPQWIQNQCQRASVTNHARPLHPGRRHSDLDECGAIRNPRTWNRPEAADLAKLYALVAPNYAAVIESYQKAQEVAKQLR
jgi:hypothetical protein